MRLLKDVATANRITAEDPGIDGELTDLIQAALLDLHIAGVDVGKVTPDSENTDPLIKRAVILYSKAHFGFDNPESERFERAFIALKQHLSLSEDYKLKESGEGT